MQFRCKDTENIPIRKGFDGDIFLYCAEKKGSGRRGENPRERLGYDAPACRLPAPNIGGGVWSLDDFFLPQYVKDRMKVFMIDINIREHVSLKSIKLMV